VRPAVVAGILVLAGGGAWAQAPAPAPPASDQVRLRYQIQVMEGVLERAVRHGAQTVARQLQGGAPAVMLFTGPARARGFQLEGYGVFFDVEVPGFAPSVMWSYRLLDQHDLNVGTALRDLKQHVQSIKDEAARSTLQQALRRIELQVGPVGPLPPAPPPAGERPVVAATEGLDPEEAAPRLMSPMPPDEAYTEEVKRALIDAMLDHGPVTVGPDEWLTVAARDNEGPLMPGSVHDAITIMLRVKGSDLAAFRAGRLTREEARKRVEVREF
jgi:hypothetical protein